MVTFERGHLSDLLLRDQCQPHMASVQLSPRPDGSDQGLPDSDADFSQFSQSSRIVQVPHKETQNQQVGLVIAKIEDIFESMVDVLTHNGNALCIPYRSRTAPPDQPARMLRFPGTTVQEATKFSKHYFCPLNTKIVPERNRTVARMIRIMELCREALVSGRLITKRSVFVPLRGSIVN